MIILKTSKQIDCIRKSCKIVAYVLSEIEKEVRPGVTTEYLNNLAETLCLDKGGYPGLKGYKGYPYALCCSKNNVVVHGFPDNVPLKDGDILSVDFCATYNGWWGDSAITIPVGNVSKHALELIDTTFNCLVNAVYTLSTLNRIGDVSRVIQDIAEKQKLNVVKEFVGHGLGKDLHEDPQIPNFGKAGDGVIIKPGLVLAIEPIVCIGSGKTKILSDGWTTITSEGGLSAHFEHTVAVTSSGIEVLTNRE